jgi:hypothetical protein
MPMTAMNASARPTLHFLCGKMAAGKSTLSKKLAAGFDAVLICEDLWLSRLYGNEIHTFDDYLKYSARLKEVLSPLVLDLLRLGNSVVLDFPGNVNEHAAQSELPTLPCKEGTVSADVTI